MTEETRDRVTEAKKYRQHLLDKLEIETSSVETLKPGNDRDGYVKALEEKIEGLKAMMDDMAEKSKTLEKNVRDEFEHEKVRLEMHYASARSRLDEIRRSGTDAWRDLHDGALNAWEELAEGVKNAVSKFR